MTTAAASTAIATLMNLASQRAPSVWTAALITPLIPQIIAAAEAISSDTSQPSVVVTDAQTLIVLASEVSTTAASGSPAMLTDITSMWTAANTLLDSALAWGVVTDVQTNGCTGYSAKNTQTFQVTDGTIPATGIYDAATVVRIQSILGSTVTIPAACPASSSGSPTPTPTPMPGSGTSTGTITPTPIPATSGTTTAVIIGASVIAIGGLAILLYKSSKTASAIKTTQGSRKRPST